MELTINFSASEMMVAVLEYHKVGARWVPRVLTWKQKEHCMQVCQDLLNKYEAEGDSFLDYIITSDNMWCHHYKLESKQQFRVATCKFPIKEKAQDIVSKVMCIVF